MSKVSNLKIPNELETNALYRFVSFNQFSLQALINKKIFFSSPLFQNDPIDSNFKINSRKYRPDPEDTREKKFIIKSLIEKKLKNEYGICCFTRKYNEILLWSHYSEGAQGFCFVFDQNKLLTSLQEENSTMFLDSVKYDGIATVTPTGIKEAILFDPNKIVFNKLKCWKYESEVRIMCKLKKDILGKLIKSYEFDTLSLKCIIVGERMSSENILTIKNILKIKGYEGVQIFKMKRDYLSPHLLRYNKIYK